MIELLLAVILASVIIISVNVTTNYLNNLWRS